MKLPTISQHVLISKFMTLVFGNLKANLSIVYVRGTE